MEQTDNTGFAGKLQGLDFDRIAASLAGLAQHQPITKKAIVRQHMAAIETALSRRVGYQAVARALTDAGCAINPSVLRRYVWEQRSEREKEREGLLRSESQTDQARALPERAVATPDHAVLSAVNTAQASPAPRRSLRRGAWLKTTNEVEDGNH